ncbi:MAG: polymer-forming cytoskeletal protein, partial [Cystobacter sp.]
PADVRLKNVSPEQALITVARAYSLKLEHDGGIYTLSPMADAEHESESEEASTTGEPAAPPVPAAPAPPPRMQLSLRSGDQDALKQRVRERMEKARSSPGGSQDVVARGRSLEVGEDETVDKAVVYGGNLQVRGHVSDDAVVFGGNLIVDGHVEGDASAFGGNVTLGPNATVEGDVSAFGGRVIKKEGAQVEGRINSLDDTHIGQAVASEVKNTLKASARERDRKSETGSKLAMFLMTFALLFGLGFLGQLFFPTRMKALGAEIREQPVRSGVVGVLGALGLVPALVMLCFTVVGIPLALALIVVLPVLTGWGFAAVASELGARLPLLGGRKTQALVLAQGLCLLLLLGRIPLLGSVLLVLATLVGLGAIMRTRFGQRPQGFPEPLFHQRSTP